METGIILSEDQYTLKRQAGIPPEVQEFLDHVAWGSDEAVYEHKGTAEHIKHLYNPYLIGIYEGEALRGTAVFCNTPITAKGRTFNCYYVRYFAASDAIRGKGLMRRFAPKAMEGIQQGVTEKTVYFATVERGNSRSYSVVERAGYAPLGFMKTLGFSRFFPKAQPQIEHITTAAQQKEVRALLHGFYSQHALVHFNSLFLDDRYAVIRHQGEIVAGVQYHHCHWVVQQMAGFMGLIVMNVVPRVPLLNQLFNPKRFEFLAFEHIYCKPGHEKQLHQLLEGLLAQEKRKSSLIWLGETCPLRKRLEDYGKFGLLHAFVKDSDAYIMAKLQHMSPEEEALLKEQPHFLSAFDFI